MLGVDFHNLPNPEELLINHIKLPGKIKITYKDEYAIHVYPIIEKVGYLCNLLKNRPWAQSNFLVSMIDFNERLTDLWIEFWVFLDYMGVSPIDVFEMFWKKYQVNLHRIRTGY